MKKIILGLLVVTIAVGFSGCAKDATDFENNKNPISGAEIKAESLSAELSALTEVTSYVGDTDADGTDERVVLATSAERDSSGDFLWNDGQTWALYVEDGPNEAYVLLDKYVQTGNVYFDVSDYYLKDGTKPKITVTVSTGSGLSIRNYTFVKDKIAYIEETIFDTKDVTEGGINKRFSSVSEIVK